MLVCFESCMPGFLYKRTIETKVNHEDLQVHNKYEKKKQVARVPDNSYI